MLLIKLIILFILYNINSINSENSEINNDIIESFKLMYKQISYTSYYIKRRIDKISYERPSLLSYVKSMKLDNENILKELGITILKELPLRTSSLDIDDINYDIEYDKKHFEDYILVESKIKLTLELLFHSFSYWKVHFNHIVGFFNKDINRLKNDTVYKLIYQDFILIFFPIIKLIYKHYNIKYINVLEQELFSKQIYIYGIKTFMDSECFIGFHNESSLIQLIKKTYWTDIDLINRMIKDIYKHFNILPNDIKSLFNIFNIYKSNLNLIS
uniref:Uncharacterized protein n=1 Tax=Theileria annulata TaxID=5874 RepID=A0A3B0MK93_THEAN